MFQPDRLTVPVAAAIPAVGVPGWFTNGDPQNDIPATPVDDWWLNMITAELRNVVVGAGLVLDKTNNAQLLAAVNTLIANYITGLGNIAYLDVVQLFTKAQGSAPVALADASPVAIDLSLSNVFTLAPTASRTLQNATNVQVGRPFLVIVTQPAPGGCGLAYDTNYVFANDEPPANTTTANAIDIYIGVGLPGNKVFLTLQPNAL